MSWEKSETEWQRCFGLKGRDGERTMELSFVCEVKQTWRAVLASPHMTTNLKKEREWTRGAVEKRERSPDTLLHQLSSNHPAVSQTDLETCWHWFNLCDATLTFLIPPRWSIFAKEQKFLYKSCANYTVHENIRVFRVYLGCCCYCLCQTVSALACNYGWSLRILLSVVSSSLLVLWFPYVSHGSSMLHSPHRSVSTHSLSFPTTLTSSFLPTSLIHLCLNSDYFF